MTFYSMAFQDRDRFKPNDRMPAIGITDSPGYPQVFGWAHGWSHIPGEPPELTWKLRWRGQIVEGLFVLRRGKFIRVEELDRGA